jgi:hypothetical protein
MEASMPGPTPYAAQNDTILRPLSKVVVSFYMDNIPASVIQSQRNVLEKFVPSDFAIEQRLTTRSHAAAINGFMSSMQYDLVVVLDIDCVPLNPRAVSAIAARAARGALTGCVQRANHIDNDGHLYVGPFCMALGRRLWENLGRPSFQPTQRGDVGEELTYRCEALQWPVHMIWPSSVEDPRWDLTDGQKFGVNTEYGRSFLHTFGISDPSNQSKFVDRCRDILLAESNQASTGEWSETDDCSLFASPGQSERGPGRLIGVPVSPAATSHSPPNDVGADPESDKFYWHRYVDKYEQAFASLGGVSDILELGVLDGASLRWLAKRFPYARIVGVDFTGPGTTWPRTDQIEYVQAAPGDGRTMAAVLARLGRRYDLIIDDGSHLPPHQASSLVEAFPFVRPGGLYILEDIHTSHPENADFRHYNPPGTANCLHILLAMQHLKDCSRPLTHELLSALSTPGFFSPENLVNLFDNIGSIELFKRTSLPLRCYSCGSYAFDYKRLRCECGVDLYSATDSMSFLIRSNYH